MNTFEDKVRGGLWNGKVDPDRPDWVVFTPQCSEQCMSLENARKQFVPENDEARAMLEPDDERTKLAKKFYDVACESQRERRPQGYKGWDNLPVRESYYAFADHAILREKRAVLDALAYGRCRNTVGHAVCLTCSACKLYSQLVNEIDALEKS